MFKCLVFGLRLIICCVLSQIVAAVQAARQRVLNEVETAHATKHAALVSFDRDARAHQTQLTAVATRATEAQRQPNLQVYKLYSWCGCCCSVSFVCLFDSFSFM